MEKFLKRKHFVTLLLFYYKILSTFYDQALILTKLQPSLIAIFWRKEWKGKIFN